MEVYFFHFKAVPVDPNIKTLYQDCFDTQDELQDSPALVEQFKQHITKEIWPISAFEIFVFENEDQMKKVLLQDDILRYIILYGPLASLENEIKKIEEDHNVTTCEKEISSLNHKYRSAEGQDAIINYSLITYETQYNFKELIYYKTLAKMDAEMPAEFFQKFSTYSFYGNKEDLISMQQYFTGNGKALPEPAQRFQKNFIEKFEAGSSFMLINY